MLKEEGINSLNAYSQEIEDNIELLISFRVVLASIHSFDDYLKEKGRLIQKVFEMEDLLRNSCHFIKKHYFQLRQWSILSKQQHEPTVYSFDDPLEENHTHPQFEFTHASNNDRHLKAKCNDEAVNSKQVISEEIQRVKESNLKCSIKPKSIEVIKTAENHSNEIETTNKNKDKQFDTIGEIDLAEKQDNEEDNIGSNNHHSSSINRKQEEDNKLKQEARNEILVDDPYQDDRYLPQTDRNRVKESLIDLERNSSNCELATANNDAMKKPQWRTRNQQTAKGLNHHSEMLNVDYDAIINNPDLVINPINTREKVKMISNLIMKLKTNEDLNEMMEQLFGSDLIDRLMDESPDEDFISAVKKSIATIELLQQKEQEEEAKVLQTASKTKQVQIPKSVKPPIQLELIDNNRLKKQKTNYKSSSSFPINYCNNVKHNTDLYSKSGMKKSFADQLLEQNGFKTTHITNQSISKVKKQPERLSFQKRDNTSNGNAMNDSLNNTRGSITVAKKTIKFNSQLKNYSGPAKMSSDGFKVRTHKKLSSHKVIKDF